MLKGSYVCVCLSELEEYACKVFKRDLEQHESLLSHYVCTSLSTILTLADFYFNLLGRHTTHLHNGAQWNRTFDL